MGMPLGFIITAGQQSDIGQGEALLGNDYCDFLLAGRGYDSDPFRKALVEKGITPVIPGRKSRKVTIQYDEHTYKERNAVERYFGRIKEFRRATTRYDKKTCMFKGTLLFASIIIWCKL
ncbi:transposase [Candidatus Neptunichlamydia sp. REUL1]|uniref:transposase n=1 Tax=Candidatus Neptunichlamydia sp. REUL1 TaxID=3064277 RepID=UPI0029314B28|nr:transposase [Candidatus Neptunochlamydia sp. REUL1]